MAGKRSFKIVAIDGKDVEDSGRYTGSSPLQAGRKAFTQICRKSKAKTCKKVFTVQESTNGSAKKQYTYRGERILLKEPKDTKRVDKDGNPILAKYESIVKKA